MRTLTYRCPVAVILLILTGATGLAFLGTNTFLVELPAWCAWYFVGAASALLLYGLSLLPSKVTISDDGIRQSLLFCEWQLSWAEMVEWRHSSCGVEVEKSEMRAKTFGKWHSDFWIRDKSGRIHRLKSWLVFSKRSKHLAEILRKKGIEGG